MPDLLFISDNPKVEQIKDLLQPMLKLEIGVTAHMERALEEILGHEPSVICIQDLLAGKAAEEIVRQIQAMGDDRAPLFVLLREGDDGTVPPEHPFAHVIDLNLPVEQLAKSILRVVLKPAFKLRWKDIYIPHEQDGLATAAVREETEPAGVNATPPKIEIPTDLLKAFEHNYHSRHRDRWMKYAAVSLAVCLVVVVWQLSSDRQDQGGHTKKTPPQRSAVQRPAAAPSLQAKKATHPTPPPLPAAIVQKAPSAPRKPVAVTASASKLPSFIPEKGRDRAYSQQKPGWERYTDAHHEFRILRSGNRIKTIQVLAATQHAISEDFLKSVLREISGNSTYQETSHQEEHGFLVKRGSAGPGVKILIYTQKSQIRAFAISLG